MCLFPLCNGLRLASIHLIGHAGTILNDNIRRDFGGGIVLQTLRYPFQIVGVGVHDAARHQRSKENQHNCRTFHDLPPDDILACLKSKLIRHCFFMMEIYEERSFVSIESWPRIWAAVSVISRM